MLVSGIARCAASKHSDTPRQRASVTSLHGFSASQVQKTKHLDQFRKEDPRPPAASPFGNRTSNKRCSQLQRGQIMDDMKTHWTSRPTEQVLAAIQALDV